MPKTNDPTKVSLLKNSRRISISVENVEALTTWKNTLDAVQQSTSDASNSNQMTVPITGKKSASVTGSLGNGKLDDRASIQVEILTNFIVDHKLGYTFMYQNL